MSDAFRGYKSDPTSDHLVCLLRACQDRVYRLCLQVLRRPHDAEDAAQEVLMRLADGARGIDDADAFRRWVYRVSLNAALEAARKSTRRRVHEARAPMNVPPEPLDEESRRTLFEAIASLDDGPRSLLLDHYFEGETLESLASRESVSPQAVSKRLERAREDLRRAIPALGAVIPDLGKLFESHGAAIPDLVSGPVLAKVAAVAGGAVMTSKSLVAGAVAIAAVACLTGGTGLGYLMKSRSESTRVRTLETRLAVAEREVAVLRATQTPTLKAQPSDTRATAPDSAPEATTPLKARLARYKAWKSRWDKDWAASQERFKTDDTYFQEMANRKDREKKELFKGMRELACQEPQAFLDYLKEQQDYVTLNEVAEYGLIFEFAGGMGIMGRQFHEFPKELTEGLLDLLRTGSTVQKNVMLELLGRMHSPPQEYKDVYLSSLDDPSVQCAAVTCVSKVVPMTQDLAQKLTRIGQATADQSVRWAVTEAMTYARFPEAEDYLLDCLETAKVGIDVDHSAGCLSRWYMDAATYAIPISEERYSQAAVAALSRQPSENGMTAIVRGALYLSPARTKAIIEQVMSASPSDKLREKLSRMISKIDHGETRRDDLLKILHGYE